MRVDSCGKSTTRAIARKDKGLGKAPRIHDLFRADLRRQLAQPFADNEPDIGTNGGTITIFACIKPGAEAYHRAAA
jgi:hypothetical protein